jgi:hypothetical protein
VENLTELGKKTRKNRKNRPQKTEFIVFAKSLPLQKDGMKDTIHFTIIEEGVTEIFENLLYI